ncbi:MAG: hypothetical protein IJT42_04180, partial [Treponema sp.]|nr:hypothetical protein [Treponema sp.]
MKFKSILMATAIMMLTTSGLFAQNKADAKSNNKTLVVYFSWSGNLDKMAHWIADETGGDLRRVTAKEAYPEDYNKVADRAKNEKDKGIRPAINVNITKEE